MNALVAGFDLCRCCLRSGGRYGLVWSGRRGGLRPSFKFRGTLIWARFWRWLFGVGWQRYTKQTTQKKKKKEPGVSEGILVLVVRSVLIPTEKQEKEHTEKGVEKEWRWM